MYFLDPSFSLWIILLSRNLFITRDLSCGNFHANIFSRSFDSKTCFFIVILNISNSLSVINFLSNASSIVGAKIFFDKYS